MKHITTITLLLLTITLYAQEKPSFYSFFIVHYLDHEKIETLNSEIDSLRMRRMTQYNEPQKETDRQQTLEIQHSEKVAQKLLTEKESQMQMLLENPEQIEAEVILKILNEADWAKCAKIHIWLGDRKDRNNIAKIEGTLQHINGKYYFIHNGKSSPVYDDMISLKLNLPGTYNKLTYWATAWAELEGTNKTEKIYHQTQIR